MPDEIEVIRQMGETINRLRVSIASATAERNARMAIIEFAIKNIKAKRDRGYKIDEFDLGMEEMAKVMLAAVEVETTGEKDGRTR